MAKITAVNNGESGASARAKINTALANLDGENNKRVDFDTAAPTATTAAGQMSWNTDEETFDMQVSPNVTIQSGRELVTLGRNNTGVQIDNGTVVYASGTIGASGRTVISPYIADGSIDPHLIIGVTTENIANGSDGNVTSFGKVRSLNTTGTPYGETWSDGDTIYASPTISGGFTNVKPDNGFISSPLASVINAATNGSIYVFGTQFDQRAKDVEMESLGNATYTNVQQMQDVFHSTGWVSGGTINDIGAGNITVDAGTGYIRPTTSEVDTLYPFDWSALGSTAIPLGTTRYIGVEYNAGSPQVVVRTTYNWNFQSEFPLGIVVNEAGTLHISNGKIEVGDHAGKMIQRLLNVNGIQRDNRVGGLTVGETGTRNLTVSAGTLWQGLSEFPISAINTSTTGSFDYYLGATLDTAAATQWDNLNYNNAGVKTALTVNRWTNNWVYLETDGNLVVLYGNAQYTSQAQAESAAAPSVVPSRITAGGRIIAQLTFQQGGATITSIRSFFDTNFNPTASSDHTNLSNLAWTTSGHTGTATRLAGFNGSGAASEYTLSGTGTAIPTTISPTFTTPALGTPSALVGTNITGTAAGLTAGVATAANGLNSATTTVSVSAATAPTVGQVLTATGGTAATWQTPVGGGGLTWGDSITDTSGTGISINNGVATQATATTYGLRIGNSFNNNSSFSFDGIYCQVPGNAGSGDNTAMWLRHDNPILASNGYKGVALSVTTFGGSNSTLASFYRGGGQASTVNGLVKIGLDNISTTPGQIGQLIEIGNSSSVSGIAQKIDLGTSAQGHTGLLINAYGASASQRGVKIDKGSTGIGIGLEIIGSQNDVNSERVGAFINITSSQNATATQALRLNTTGGVTTTVAEGGYCLRAENPAVGVVKINKLKSGETRRNVDIQGVGSATLINMDASTTTCDAFAFGSNLVTATVPTATTTSYINILINGVDYRIKAESVS